MSETSTRDAIWTLIAAQAVAGAKPVTVDDLFTALCMPRLVSGALLDRLGFCDERLRGWGRDAERLMDNDSVWGARGTILEEFAEDVRLSESAAEVTRLAESEAMASHDVGSHHLLLGLVLLGDNEASRVVSASELSVIELKRLVDFARPIVDLGGSCVSAGQSCFNGDLRGTRSTSVRERETMRLLKVLSRRTKNNAVLVGDPGVGRTTVLDDLARRFTERGVTHSLSAKEIFRVAWDRLRTTARNTSAAADRLDLTQCVDIAADDRRVILVFDDIARHVDFEAHLGSGGVVAALWRQLTRENLQCVFTMTPAEYARFATHSPLRDFFEPVRIPELSTSQTVTVLKVVARESLGRHHGVSFTDGAINTAADLANRFIPDQFLPAKAITLLDEACANLQTSRLDPQPHHPNETSPYRHANLVDTATVRETLADLKGIPIHELTTAGKPAAPQPTSARSTVTRLPHRSTSTALLLGTAHYTHPAIPDTPAIVNNLLSLRRRLTDTETGSFDPDRIHQPDGDLGNRHIPELVRATRDATDTLLLYYSGHGYITEDGRLHLGLADTDPELWEFTALPYNTLRKAVYDAPARNKIVILDCCFAGRAIDDLSDSPSSGQLDIDGSYVLTATTATRTAHASDGAAHTAFTGALLDVLGEGVDETEELIKLSAIYSRLDRRLIAKGLPKPQQRGTNNIHDLALTRNPRWNSSLGA